MRRRPSDVIDVVAVVLERIERLVLFQAPEFDGPVDGGCQEEMGEVYSALHRVRANAGDRSLVTLVRFRQSGTATMSTGYSHNKIFKCVSIILTIYFFTQCHVTCVDNNRIYLSKRFRPRFP